jgi:hypothetical protein
MQSDPYTRAMLTFIALALLVLVAQGFGLGRAEPEPEPSEGRGVWTLQMLRTGLGGPPTFVRLDTATGEVWQTKFGANQDWELVGVAREAAGAPAEPAPAQAPPPAPVPPAPAPEAPPQP